MCARIETRKKRGKRYALRRVQQNQSMYINQRIIPYSRHPGRRIGHLPRLPHPPLVGGFCLPLPQIQRGPYPNSCAVHFVHSPPLVPSFAFKRPSSIDFSLPPLLTAPPSHLSLYAPPRPLSARVSSPATLPSLPFTPKSPHKPRF